MPVVDLAQREDVANSAALTSCDICIIGAGPAGATLASELSGAQMSVTLLESGGFDAFPETEALNDIDNVGRPRAQQSSVRNRIVGGSSHTWGGRCAPFDAIDFEARDWVPMSGWPLRLDDLEPYLQRTAPHLGLAIGFGFNDERFWEIAGRRPPAKLPDPAGLLPFFWQFSRANDESYPYEYVRFGRGLAGRLGSNVTLLTGATVLRVDPVESGTAVRSIHIAGPDGHRFDLHARTVVLCAGGIENCRILLSSNGVTPQGLGNDCDLVGRYLMDHLRGPIGTFRAGGSQALQKRLGRYNVRDHLFRAGFRLSPEVQRTEQLMNCAAWLGEVVARDDPWDALRRVVGRGSRKPGDITAIASNADLLVRGLKQYFIDRNGFPRKLAALTLDCMVEQCPDPESRVTLSNRRDRFGTRLARVNWRSSEIEAHTMYRMAALLAEQLPRMGLPQPDLVDWVRNESGIPSSFVDVAHPTGTTRMADDPAKGVVNVDSQVHGVDGLYVTGSSVFPTAGHCNPTQMIVAMAIRLADHLKQRAASAAITVRALDPEPLPAPTVLLTGATGRIGRVVLDDLIERGYRVRATTSRPIPEAHGATQAVEWRHLDFLEAGADEYDSLVAGCEAVIHLAAEIGKMDRMSSVNVEATQLLAEAAEHAGTEAFCYTSTVAVYGSGRQRVMTEDAPVLTVDRDDPSEYLALEYVRAYGRTKLAGERALQAAAQSVRYVVMRPTVVVDIDDIIGIRDWSSVKRVLAAHRHAHHIYVRDVSHALLWAMERALGGSFKPGSVEVFNLSDDEFQYPTHAEFMKKAFAASRDPRLHVPSVPGTVDWAHDVLRFRIVSVRNPLWRMRFPTDRLRAAGYRRRFGMAHAHELALEAIRTKVKSDGL